MNARRLGLAIAFGVAAIALACGSDEPIASTHDHASDAAPDATTRFPEAGNPDAAPVDAGPAPKRTLITRNPFGNVAVSDNLLWDGDFEWHSPFASQYGWVYTSLLIGAGGFNGVRVGAECRSGMKCGLLTQNQRVAGIGVSPSNRPVRASIWVRPSTGKCEDARIHLIPCDWGIDPDLPVEDADGAPDADGWCEHVLIAEPRQRASCLLVEAIFQVGEMLLDDAQVTAAPEGSEPSTAAWVPSPEVSARAEEARVKLRDWLRPGRARSSDVLEAFEAFRRRRR